MAEGKTGGEEDIHEINYYPLNFNGILFSICVTVSKTFPQMLVFAQHLLELLLLLAQEFYINTLRIFWMQFEHLWHFGVYGDTRNRWESCKYEISEWWIYFIYSESKWSFRQGICKNEILHQGFPCTPKRDRTGLKHNEGGGPVLHTNCGHPPTDRICTLNP